VGDLARSMSINRICSNIVDAMFHRRCNGHFGVGKFGSLPFKAAMPSSILQSCTVDSTRKFFGCLVMLLILQACTRGVYMHAIYTLQFNSPNILLVSITGMGMWCEISVMNRALTNRMITQKNHTIVCVCIVWNRMNRMIDCMGV
jgi:hypothetical protein